MQQGEVTMHIAHVCMKANGEAKVKKPNAYMSYMHGNFTLLH